MSRNFVACKKEVHNRGIPPSAFLDELVDWAKGAPDEIFEPNQVHDIYTNVVGDLGPWTGLTHRKAAMLEVLRVLGGFESSWDWNEGVDVMNPHSNTSCTEEAGIFQCSGNSMDIDSSLKEMLVKATGKKDCETFKIETKANHTFAIEYCARLLRFTVRHHGPVRDHHINGHLRRDAVAEFEGFLTNEA
jgi:hypothetical protein